MKTWQKQGYSKPDKYFNELANKFANERNDENVTDLDYTGSKDDVNMEDN